MIAAKGKLPANAPPDTLEGAMTAQATSSNIVQTTTVTKLFAIGRDQSVGMLCIGCDVSLIYGRTFAARNLSKASVKDRTEF